MLPSDKCDVILYHIITYVLMLHFELQEVFHVYLNKFENAVTHLFLVILGNYWF